MIYYVLPEIWSVTFYSRTLLSPSLTQNTIHIHSIHLLYRTKYYDLEGTHFQFAHKPLGWCITLGYDFPNFTLEINNVKYEDMAEAPPRERATLARTAISMQMAGPKKSSRFGLLRKGQYIGVSVVLNMHTKFAKLQVGKHVVSAKLRHSQDPVFPLAIALINLSPLTKVWVDYLPMPKNTFIFRVNDDDIYSLVKEEADYDPTKTETLSVNLNVNDI